MAKEFSAGTVYVQVLPSLDGWKKEFDKQLAKQLGTVKAQVSIDPQIDTAALRARLSTALQGLTIDVPVDLDDAAALTKLARLRQQVATVDGKTAHINVDADTAAALAKLNAVKAASGNRTMRINATVDDGGSIDSHTSRLALLVAAAIAGSGAIGGLGAALVALGAAAVVGAAGIAAVVVGTSAISAAMKAQTAATQQAGQTAAQEAAQQLTAANQLANAQDGLKNAIQGVGDAQRTASDTMRTALEGQTRAEEQLRQEQVSALRAQVALTDARRDAARGIEDLSNRVVDDALAQRQAVLDLESAQTALDATMSNPAASERQRAEAQLNFDQAQQHLSETGLAYQRSTVDAQAATAAGVDGAKQVISAQDQLTDTQTRLRDAQVSAADAAHRVDEARITGAEQVARAQQQVIQAQRSLAQASASVTTQEQKQGQAHEKFAAALDKLAPQSLALIGYLRSQSGEWTELGKSSQAFAPGLQRSLQVLAPSFGALNDNVSTVSASFGSFLQVVAGGLVQAQPTFDVIAASAVDLFPRFGQTVNLAGQAVGGLVVAMLPLAKPALDAVDAFSALIQTWTPFIVQASGPLLAGLQEVIKNLDFLGPLLVAVAKPAADLTLVLVQGLRAGFQALTPALGPFLQALVDIVATLAPLLGSAGQLAGLAASVLTPALQAVNLVLKPLVDIVGFFTNVLSAIPAPLLGFVAGLVALRLAAGPLNKVVSEAGAAMGTMATQVGVGAKAASGISSVFAGIGKALPIVGIAFLGLSEIMAQNAEEARKNAEMVEALGAALNKGGSAATHAQAGIAALRQEAQALADHNLPAMATQLNNLAGAAEQSAQRQRDSMSSVELAQGRVTQAQADYDKAVRDHGPISNAALTAQDLLRIALGGLKQAQNDAADATKTHTERLQDLQDQILAMTDATVAHDRANLRLQQGQSRLDKAIADNKKDLADAAVAQNDLTKAIQKYGKGTEPVRAAQAKYNEVAQRAADSAISIKEAQLDLTSAQSAYISTAGAAAAATAKAGGAQDTTAAKTKGTNQALIDLLRTQGDALPPSILQMISHLDAADQKFFGLTTTVDGTGQTILSLPGGPNQPPVDIKFRDNIPAVQQDLSNLKTDLTNFDQFLKGLLTGPGVGVSSLAGLLGLNPAAGTSAAGKPKTGTALDLLPGHAGGGPVPGVGTGDTVPSLLTPGEFVFSKPAVRTIGMGNLAAFHAAALRYARGGPVRGYAGGGAVAGSASAGDAPPELGWLTAIVAAFTQITQAANPLAVALDRQVTPAHQALTDATIALAVDGRQSWKTLTDTVAASTGVIVGTQLPALRTGLSQVDIAATNTASTFGTQWALIRGYTADPVRYALAGPVNQGLIPAWNLIDTTFGVGKPLAAVPIPFSAGGGVFGGDPGKDSVAAYLMPGEFVVPVPMVRQIGMGNLESARRSVLAGGSAEGLVPGFEAGGAVSKALAFASSQVGKPYIWGGVGPAGFDCSGLVSAVTNVALGLAPYARRFTTADFAADHGAGGFLPGRNSALVIGVSDAHMAGTLGGHNFESTTKNGISGVRVDGDASGALDRQFSKGQFYLPAVGGTFVPGPSGGAAFDVGALLDSTFAPTRDAIAGIAPAFPGNTIAAGATAELAQMLSSVVGWAKANLAVSTGAPGTGPVADQVRAVAARYGWGDGAEWNALSTLISHESGWNPNAQNPTSTAYGLFQFLDGTWGGYGIPKTSNPALQAEAGMRYIQARYHDPVGAWNFWANNHWYDDGGYLPPGLSLSYNGTGRAERVLTAGQEASLMAGQSGGEFTGALYLDSGAFLGQVRGEIQAANDATGRAIARRTRH